MKRFRLNVYTQGKWLGNDFYVFAQECIVIDNFCGFTTATIWKTSVLSRHPDAQYLAHIRKCSVSWMKIILKNSHKNPHIHMSFVWIRRLYKIKIFLYPINEHTYICMCVYVCVCLVKISPTIYSSCFLVLTNMIKSWVILPYKFC